MEIKIALRAIACVEINKNMQKIEIKIAMRVSSKKKKSCLESNCMRIGIKLKFI